MRIEDLSVNERILVHLKDFSMDPESEGASIRQTQEGIAEAVGIRINHVPRATNSLLEDGYISEALMHIGGLKRKRKVFFLTTKGAEISLGIISKVKGQSVTFRDSDGNEKNATIQEMLFGAKDTTISHIILSFFREGVVLESSINEEKNIPRISMLDSLQPPENFVNRVSEMKSLRERLESGEKLTIISGIKGIGKTSLAWKVLKEFEGKKNIFWYSAHEWDTARSVLEQIADFYVRLERNEVKKLLRISRDVDIGQAVATILRDAIASDSLLAIDNIFNLKKEVMQLIYMLSEQSHKLDDSSIILITRDREALGGAPCLQNMGKNDIILKGLDMESAMKLMKTMGLDREDGDRVFAMTQGHPLAMKLVNSEEIRALIDTKGLTKEEVWVVRCMKAFDAIFEE